MPSVSPLPAFWDLSSAAARGGIETTIGQIEASLVFDGCSGILEHVIAIGTFLSQAGLELSPPLEAGPMEGLRVLRLKHSGHVTGGQVILNELVKGESFEREFKSSLYFDRAKFERSPGLPGADYKSEDVAFAALKAIAAFANSSGGTLFIGVRDDATIVGIEDDLQYAKRPDVDAWALSLRDRILSSFREGASVNDYVSIQVYLVNVRNIAKIDVARRKDLCYLKDRDAKYQVFRRQGNRSVKTEMWEIEDFVRLRDGQSAPRI